MKKKLLYEDITEKIIYLKATGKKVGLLINFGKKSLEWKRFICESYFKGID